MKRLSFFKVYGRVDPRLESNRYSLRSGSLSMFPVWHGADCVGRYRSPAYIAALNRQLSGMGPEDVRVAFFCESYPETIMGEPAHQSVIEYTADVPPTPRFTMETVTLAVNEVRGWMEAETTAALRIMVDRRLADRAAFISNDYNTYSWGSMLEALANEPAPELTVEAIREREKQNFLCNQRNAKQMAQPTTQRKIDRMFGRHDPSGRKESLAHHAHAIRLKLEAKGMDTKEVEKFIASLSLEESAVNQKQTLP